MPELPPTNIRPTDPDEPERTGRFDGSATPAGYSTPDDITPGILIDGKYKLLQPIGEGGMGAVWMAQQIEPVKRHVALKLIRAGMDSKTILARFEAERQALSMMDHPNIARVFDVGSMPNGRPYFVMELVKGTPITDFCDQRKLTPRQRLELFVPVCLAIQHAHQKGIIHRDIKPSDVLVSLHDDKPIPKVIDFGVAKATGFTLTEKTLNTGFEQVVGTPAYMSPEQATFNQLDIDTRSDVYSLGVLLYELLTGTTPIERQRFKQAALLEMLRIVREEEPPRPSTRLSSTETKASIAEKRGTEPMRLAKELRTELDWVVMKSLEKDRARRYATAMNFAEDVQRYLAGEAVQAHPPSASYRIRKFVRRHRTPVVAAAAILLGLIGGGVGTVYGVIKADGEREATTLREQAERDRDAKELAREAAENALSRESLVRTEIQRLNYEHAIGLANRELLAGNLRRARELVNTTHSEWEARYLRCQCNAELSAIETGGFPAALSYSADGRKIAATVNGVVRLWDAANGQQIAELSHRQKATVSAFSPDGRWIATGSIDGECKIWDGNTRAHFSTETLHRDAVLRLSFSNDGRRLISISKDNSVCVFDLGSSQVTRTVRCNSAVNEAGLSADHTLLSIVAGGKVQIWDVGTDERIREQDGVAVVFSPDSRRAYIIGRKTVQIWDRNTGVIKLVELQGITQTLDLVTSAFLSPDGAMLVTRSLNSVRVWNCETGVKRAEYLGSSGLFLGVSFSFDEVKVAFAQYRSLIVWVVGAALPHTYEWRGHDDSISEGAFSADGLKVATASADGTARTWSTECENRRESLWDDPNTASIGCSLSRDGNKAITAFMDSSARLWDGNDGRFLQRFPGESDVFSASISADGKTVVIESGLGLEVRSLRTGMRTHRFEHQREVSVECGRVNARLSPTGTKLVASVGLNANVWDLATSTTIQLSGHSKPIRTGSFSEDASYVVTASEDSTAKIWESSTGKLVATLQGHGDAVNYACFSRDGRKVLTVSKDRTAKIWESDTGRLMKTLAGHAEELYSADFSPSGNRAVTASRDRTVRVWNVESGNELLSLVTHSGPVVCAVFSDDEQSLFTAGYTTTPVWISAPIRLVRYDARSSHELDRRCYIAPAPRAER